MTETKEADSVVYGLEAMLSQVTALKTGERSEEQRKIAILAAKIEDSVAWAKYTFETLS